MDDYDSNEPYGGPVDLPDAPKQTDPHNYYKPAPKSRSPKKIIIVLAILLLVTVLGFGAMKVFGKKKVAPAPVVQTPVESSPEKKLNNDVPDVKETKLYENGPLGVDLTYPTTWTVTETADNGIRIESPAFSYVTIDKGLKSGYFRVYIRKGARAADSKYIGRGVAIKDSEKLTYTKPTTGQRPDTLLSFFGLDTPNNFGYFFVAGNFQLKTGDTLGPDYGKEAETFIVSGGFSAKDLTDDMATNTVAAESYQESKAYLQAIDIIKSLRLH